MFKQAILFISILLLITACKPNNDEVTREVVLHYCDMHFKHYQPVDFEPKQEYYVPYERSSLFKTYNTRKKLLTKQKDSLKHLINIENRPAYLLQANAVDSALSSVKSDMARDKQNYKPVRRGWMIVHTYNQQPATGSMVRTTSVFVIDADLKNVLETYDN